MSLKKESARWVYFLCLDRKLPQEYFLVSEFLSQFEIMLVPVALDQLLRLFPQKKFPSVILVVSHLEAWGLVKKQLRLLNFLVRTRRAHLHVFSSYDLLRDGFSFSKISPFDFNLLPIQMDQSSLAKILKTMEKSGEENNWPGGRHSFFNLSA